VGRAVSEIVQSPTPVRADAVEELREGAARVLIARRFYNDAVRDTRTLRARRMPRLLRLAGRRAVPQFFDIDDTLPAAAQPNPPATSETEPPRPETAKESS
ncbi:MAG: hypothetical protein QOF12_2568, partial [Solirubrobacteraceae bacterium]|nr:hypothetical protein [Solirubrobacteraceae bacterium]